MFTSRTQQRKTMLLNEPRPYMDRTEKSNNFKNTQQEVQRKRWMFCISSRLQVDLHLQQNTVFTRLKAGSLQGGVLNKPLKYIFDL